MSPTTATHTEGAETMTMTNKQIERTAKKLIDTNGRHDAYGIAWGKGAYENRSEWLRVALWIANSDDADVAVA